MTQYLNVILMRYGEQTEGKISDLGIMQMYGCAETLKDEKMVPNLVLSSRNVSSKQSAGVFMLGLTGKPVTYADNVRFLNDCHNWNPKNFPQVRKDFETLKDVCLQSNYQTVICVSNGIKINYLIRALLGKNRDLSPGDMAVVQVHPRDVTHSSLETVFSGNFCYELPYDLDEISQMTLPHSVGRTHGPIKVVEHGDMAKLSLRFNDELRGRLNEKA